MKKYWLLKRNNQWDIPNWVILATHIPLIVGAFWVMFFLTSQFLKFIQTINP